MKRSIRFATAASCSCVIALLVGCGGSDPVDKKTADATPKESASNDKGPIEDKSPATPSTKGDPKSGDPKSVGQTPATQPTTDSVAPDEKGLGVAIGETISFKLKDQDGKERTLTEIAGDGRLALVFHRSADW